MAEPVSINIEEIYWRARSAGLDQLNCAFLAADQLVNVSSYWGIDISNEETVRLSLQRADYNPASVGNIRSGGYSEASAQIGCQACKTAVTINGNHYNQKIVMPEGNNKCPLFNEKKTNLSDDELFAEDFIRTGECLGCYAECFGYEDDSDGRKKYYALVMPKDQYDKLLQEENERRAEYAEFHHVSYSPWKCLPWEVQIEQPRAWVAQRSPAGFHEGNA